MTEIDGMSLGRWESCQNFTEGLLAAEVNKIWRTVTLLHKKFTEVDRRSPVGMEIRRKLMEVIVAARIVDRSWRKISRLHTKLTEVDGSLLAARKVDGRWCKVAWPHGKLTENDGKSFCCTGSKRKLTKSLPTAPKVYGRSSAAWKVDGN